MKALPSIINNNTKGVGPNISRGRDTCPPIAYETCIFKCYDAKFCKMRASVRKNRTNNSRAWKDDPIAFENTLRKYLTRRKPNTWRWQVGGDVGSQEYWEMMKRIARDFPAIRFLVFSKWFDLLRGRVPGNLAVILSIWGKGVGGRHMTKADVPYRVRKRFPMAFTGDCTAWEGFDDAVRCNGQCDACGMCWDLKKTGKNVRFELH